MKLILAMVIFFSASLSVAAGTVTVTRAKVGYNKIPTKVLTSMKSAEVVTITWVADAAAATVPNTSIDLFGYVIKAITNPGTPAPTASYGVQFMDPEDVALDAFGGILLARHTSNTEQVAPIVTGGSVPLFVGGTYTFKVSGNAVNSATGRVILYLVD